MVGGRGRRLEVFTPPRSISVRSLRGAEPRRSNAGALLQSCSPVDSGGLFRPSKFFYMLQQLSVVEASMSSVTRRALRVYSALAELRGNNADILDALVPFFEPILEVMNGKIFDPALFAVGVRRLYRWRFTKDIAEQFIPRLQRRGYLQRTGDTRGAAYVVKYTPPDEAVLQSDPISDALKKIINEFESFPPRITDLLNYHRTRDELTDILIRFLVEIDAYRAAFASGLENIQLEQASQSLAAKIEEGESQLGPDDRYMCARFVKHIAKERSEFVPYLAKLASIGLLTEVVVDFVKPVQPTTKVDLTIAVDAPWRSTILDVPGKHYRTTLKAFSMRCEKSAVLLLCFQSRV